MSKRYVAALVTVVALMTMAPLATAGQASDGWTAPRTVDGHPDLQGYWTTQTFTPLEQPEHLAGKEFFTEEEVAAL